MAFIIKIMQSVIADWIIPLNEEPAGGKIDNLGYRCLEEKFFRLKSAPVLGM